MSHKTLQTNGNFIDTVAEMKKKKKKKKTLGKWRENSIITLRFFLKYNSL